VLEQFSLSKSCFTVRRGEVKRWLIKESLNKSPEMHMWSHYGLGDIEMKIFVCV